MTGSEIARFRQEQTLREQAAHQGLNGFAIVASHELIIARMERGAERLLQLMREGRHNEVITLMELPTWGLEEKDVTLRHHNQSSVSEREGRDATGADPLEDANERTARGQNNHGAA